MRFANANPGDFPPDDYRIDPYDVTRSDTEGLIALIRRNASETEIDLFLRKRLPLLSFISSFFCTGHHKSWVIPQAEIKSSGFANGSGLIPDYLFAGDNSDFTSPYGIIIIGRQAELERAPRKKARKSQFNRRTHTIQIKTYDALIRELVFFSEASYKLPFLTRLYTSLFFTEDSTHHDRWFIDEDMQIPTSAQLKGLYRISYLIGVMTTFNTTNEKHIPKKLPFLESICWQTENIYRFTRDQMLSSYERGWRYRQLFNNLEGEELNFLKKLAKKYNSWLQTEL